MTKEELAKAYANEFNKEYQQIAYDAFLCGYGAKCDTIAPEGLEEAAQKVEDYYDVGEEHGYLCCHRGDIKNTFIAGAEWQMAKMMEGAMEGFIERDICGQLILGGIGEGVGEFMLLDSLAFPEIHVGEYYPVKIIIVKEDK